MNNHNLSLKKILYLKSINFKTLIINDKIKNHNAQRVRVNLIINLTLKRCQKEKEDRHKYFK